MVDSPIRTLEKARNKKILVHLKNNDAFSGRLQLADAQMNMLLEDAHELDEVGNKTKRLGRVFLRGNNIQFVKLNPEE